MELKEFLKAKEKFVAENESVPHSYRWSPQFCAAGFSFPLKLFWIWEETTHPLQHSNSTR